MEKDILTIERRKLYDAISRVLTDYEQGEAEGEDLYEVLVDIQNNWDEVITAEEGN